MKIKNLILLMTATVAASSLSSCKEEPYVITREEQYARDFIKTFGIIAEGHDWTAAQHTDVTVKTQTSTKVKIYADYNGETYLFGNYDVNPGSSTLKFDIPKGATNICLKANDRKIAFTPGQTVDLSNPASREVNVGTHGSAPSVTITRLYGNHSYLTIDMDEMTSFDDKTEEDGKVTPGKLPESDSGSNFSVKKTNWDADGVTKNFKAIGQEFYLFPEYWNTGSYSVNIFGIYFEIDENDYNEDDASHIKREVVNHIVDADGNNTTETKIYYLKTIPIFDGTITELKGCKVMDEETVVENVSSLYNIPEKFRNMIAQGLCSAYPDTYYQDSPPYGGYMFVKEDKTTGYILYDQLPDFVKKDIAIVFPDMFTWSVDKGVLNFHGKAYEESIYETDVANTKGKYDFYRSYGVKVELSQRAPFGFYIKQGNNLMYSESKFNAQIEIEDLDGKIKWMNCCYGATYLDGTDSEGNDKRYLLFEDWFTDVGTTVNFDMNDLMFRAYGFDNYRPGIDRPTGDVEDHDDPKEEDQPFRWIVACEDLGGADDYDFNDVVFGVEHVSGEREVYVTALAAGGTLETHLMFNGTEVIGGKKDSYNDDEFGQYTADGSGKTFKEWHKWFGSNSFTNMINTTSFSKVGATVVLVLPKGTEFSMANTAQVQDNDTSKFGGFSVKVINNNQESTEISAPAINDTNGVNTEKTFPQMFVTTVDYKWPTERTSIYYSHQGNKDIKEVKTIKLNGSDYKVYENSFHHWVQNNVDGFHTQKPTGNVIIHGWTGYKK